MRIHLFDAGLLGPTGHHADWALRIGASLVRRGHAVQLIAHRDLSTELAAALQRVGCTVTPRLSHYAYSALPPPGDLATASAMAAQAGEELAGCGPADLWLLPTLDAPGLAALAALAQRAVQAPQAAGLRVAGLLHQPLDDADPTHPALWAQALASLRARGARLSLGAIDAVVAQAVAPHAQGLALRPWPQPIDGVVAPPRPALRTVGFFGSQRAERGVAQIPPLADALLAAGYQVLIHDSLGQFSPRGEVPGLRLVQGFVTDLAPLLGACDLVVNLLDPARYRRRTSGIASLAVACGRPLLLPEGTLAAQRLGDLDSVVTYQDADTAALKARIDTLAADHIRISAAAMRAATEWAARQGLERFVEAALMPPGGP